MNKDKSQWMVFMIEDEILFKNSKFCISNCSMRQNLMQQKNNGGLVGHFRNDKTFVQFSHLLMAKNED